MLRKLSSLFMLLLSPLSGESYKLTLQAQSPGLFCVFNTVLGALDEYDRGVIDGLTVDFEEKGLYYDAKKGPNWWNYYFEPIAIGNQEQPQLFPQYKKTIYALRGEFDISIERAHELIGKYIQIKPDVLNKIDEMYNRHFKDSYVIGIHYRGTDKKKEAPIVTYEEYQQNIDEILEGKERCKLFVATDDAKFFEFMNEKYPGQVFGLDALRSSNGKPVHMAEKKDNYRKGEEAVIDALLLSRCQFLLKNSSNLSHCSREFNPKIPTRELNTCFYNE